MAEQYRKLFLDQVKFIIEKDPNKDSLFELALKVDMARSHRAARFDTNVTWQSLQANQR